MCMSNVGLSWIKKDLGRKIIEIRRTRGYILNKEVFRVKKELKVMEDELRKNADELMKDANNLKKEMKELKKELEEKCLER